MIEGDQYVVDQHAPQLLEFIGDLSARLPVGPVALTVKAYSL
jgi:hypothetical protein